MSVRLVAVVVAACALLASPLAAEATARPAQAAAVDPASALRAFMAAAREGRFDRMWAQLSPRSRARLGPTLTRFRAGAGPQLRERVAGFSARARLIVNERIDLRFGVAAVAGRRRAAGRTRYDAFAAAARLERAGWQLELGGPVKLHAIRPNPGERVVRRTQIAAGVAAHAAIAEAGLWVDGLAFPSRGGMTDPRHLTMWDEAPQPLRAGHHTVVAFASAGQTASAIAWAFSVVR